MHPRAIFAIARKDALEILLDRTALAGLLFPILMTLVFLVISKLVGGHATTMLIYNPGQSRVQQIVSGSFATTRLTFASSPDAVTAAFGSNGTRRRAAYDVGLIVPANFDAELQTGARPQLTLYVNGGTINVQELAALRAAILNYARAVAAPQPPIILVTATINPAPAINVGQTLATIYTSISLLVSFSVGISLMPSRLIEEKEKKTLRVLLVAPASYGDVIAGKLLPILVYQLALSVLVVIIIQGGVPPNAPLVLLYIGLGVGFALALGLLIGGIFRTASAAAAVSGLAIFVLILPGLFVGQLGQLLGGNSLATTVSRLVPSYYLADGVFNAMQRQGSFSGNLLDMVVVLGSAVILLLLATWLLRRQAAIAATI